MTDAEKFEVVLEELGQLLLRLGDLAEHVVLVGGQVIALEDRARGGTGILRVETSTGPVVDRGYTLEPDLLLDSPHVERTADELPHALRACGFERTRSFRWAKKAGGTLVEIDLFAPPGTEEEALPTDMTLLPKGDLALARARRIPLRSGRRNSKSRSPIRWAFSR